jgi:ribonuclease P protein component
MRPARIGVSASKALGGAVQRNRAKRRLREAIRALGRPLEPGVDAVFIATRGTPKAEFQELVDNVRTVAEKAGALSA